MGIGQKQRLCKHGKADALYGESASEIVVMDRSATLTSSSEETPKQVWIAIAIVVKKGL